MVTVVDLQIRVVTFTLSLHKFMLKLKILFIRARKINYFKFSFFRYFRNFLRIVSNFFCEHHSFANWIKLSYSYF